MINLSIRQILYLTFGGLLFLTLVVIYSGYRHSEQTISFLNTVIDRHGPILRDIEEVMHLLQKTDEVFHLRALQTEITASDISVLYDRLKQHSNSLLQISDSGLEQQLTASKQSLEQIITSDDRQQRKLYFQQLKQEFDFLRLILYQIYSRLSADGKSGSVAETIQIMGDISTEIEIQVQQFCDQEILRLEQVIEPLEQAYLLLQKIQYPQKLNLELSEVVADDLGALAIAVKRLKSAILFFEEESARLDPSEAHVERAKVLVNEMRKLVLGQIASVSSDLRVEIRQTQSQLTESARRNQELFLLLSVVSTLLAISIGVVISRLISNSAQALELGATEFAEGNLDYRVPQLKIREFSAFSSLFNRMASSLELKQKKILESLKSLNKINEELDQRVIERTAEMEIAVKKAEQANMAKSLFLSNITHELRTPMHAILGFSELGANKAGSAKNDSLARYFDRISESGGRLLALINDLLDLSKLESGKMEYDFQVQSLKPVFDGVENELESLLDDKAIKIIYDSELDYEFYFDEERIHQVLVNLFSNSIKFSPAHSTITVACNSSSLPSGSRYNDPENIQAIEIIISDQGIGIPKDQIDTIFDSFVQSSKTRTAAGGTGLGLSICQQIIQAHHGIIKARNRDEGGTDIIFTLPLPTATTAQQIAMQ